MRKTSEAEIEKYLARMVRINGGEIRKARWIGRVGCPDRFIFGKGWVELKTAKGKLSMHQELEIERMREYGEKVYVVRSKADVDALMREIYDN